jgi:hypothetical protein
MSSELFYFLEANRQTGSTTALIEAADDDTVILVNRYDTVGHDIEQRLKAIGKDKTIVVGLNQLNKLKGTRKKKVLIDTSLLCEMVHRVEGAHSGFNRLHEQLDSKDREIERLRKRLERHEPNYDPYYNFPARA